MVERDQPVPRPAPSNKKAPADRTTPAPTGPEPMPEFATAAWKQRVEGEARRRLNNELRGAGAKRRA